MKHRIYLGVSRVVVREDSDFDAENVPKPDETRDFSKKRAGTKFMIYVFEMLQM